MGKRGKRENRERRRLTRREENVKKRGRGDFM